ncbi:MlaD family protein [Marinicella rhabdoformis]|uniref:MlaD family protein n=1 Tax=Marinicella rhabdoformis TaxID=2580566 RepID=UPI0015D0CB55|nr:MlaD family protein [Marinicella rhabdoformis]
MTGKSGDVEEYHSYYNNVTGLSFGTPVYYEGYRIGQVEHITPEAKPSGLMFKVSYTIQQGWQIRTDANAQIQSAGLLADMSININAGKESSFFKPGDIIPGRMPEDLFAQLGEVSEDITDITEDQIKPMLDMLNTRLDSITKQVDDGLPEIMQNIKDTTANLNQVAQSAKQVLNQENTKNISLVLENMNQLSDNMKASLEALDKSMNNIDALITDARGLVTDDDSIVAGMLATLNRTSTDASHQLNTILNEIESASMNLNEVTNSVRKNPATLIFSKEQGDDDL